MYGIFDWANNCVQSMRVQMHSTSCEMLRLVCTMCKPVSGVPYC